MPTGKGGAPRWRVGLSFATLYIVWGTTYLGIRFAVESLPPMLMGAARFLVAGAVLYPIMRLSGNPAPKPVQWRSALIVGAFLMVGGQGGVAWAERRIPSGLAAALVATMPLWMLVVNWMRPRGQAPDARLVTGILAGFAGVVLLVAPWQTNARDVDIWGILAVVGGALSWAVGSLYSTTARLPRSHLLATAMQMLAGGVLLLLVATARGEWQMLDWGAVSLRSLLALAYLVVFGSLIGLTTYTWLLTVRPPSQVSTYSYVNPVVAVFLGWLLAGEHFSARMLLAIAIILGSVVLATRGTAHGRSAGQGGEGSSND